VHTGSWCPRRLGLGWETHCWGLINEGGVSLSSESSHPISTKNDRPALFCDRSGPRHSRMLERMPDAKLNILPQQWSLECRACGVPLGAHDCR